MSKSIDGKCIPELWRLGRKRRVLNYNQKNCDLTKQLWLCMIRGRAIRINYRDFSEYCFLPCNSCEKIFIVEISLEGKAFVRRDHYRQRLDFQEIKLSPTDKKVLAGTKPFLTFPRWRARIKANGCILPKAIHEREAHCPLCQSSIWQFQSRQTGKVRKYEIVGEFRRWVSLQNRSDIVASLARNVWGRDWKNWPY